MSSTALSFSRTLLEAVARALVELEWDDRDEILLSQHRALTVQVDWTTLYEKIAVMRVKYNGEVKQVSEIAWWKEKVQNSTFLSRSPLRCSFLTIFVTNCVVAQTMIDGYLRKVPGRTPTNVIRQVDGAAAAAAENLPPAVEPALPPAVEPAVPPAEICVNLPTS